jgi:hypothetical protein
VAHSRSSKGAAEKFRKFRNSVKEANGSSTKGDAEANVSIEEIQDRIKLIDHILEKEQSKSIVVTNHQSLLHQGEFYNTTQTVQDTLANMLPAESQHQLSHSGTKSVFMKYGGANQQSVINGQENSDLHTFANNS